MRGSSKMKYPSTFSIHILLVLVTLVTRCSTRSIIFVSGFAPVKSSRHLTRIPFNLGGHFAKGQLARTAPTTFSSTRVSAQLLPFLDEETSQKLLLLTFEKLIDAGIPAVFVGLTAWWLVSIFRRDEEDGGNRGSGRRRRGLFQQRGKSKYRDRSLNDSTSRPLGPVEELYDDIYDDLSGTNENDGGFSPILRLLGGKKSGGVGQRGDFDRPTSKLNIGIPKSEYLKVTKLNSKYDSYRYSMMKATRGKSYAASDLREKGFESALVKALGIGAPTSTSGVLHGLTPAEGTALLTLERDFLSDGAKLLNDVAEWMREIINAAVLDEMDDMGVEAGVLDAIVDKNSTVIDAQIIEDSAKTDVVTHNETSASLKKRDNDKEKNGKNSKKIDNNSDMMRAIKEVEAINTEILYLEISFIQSIISILGPNRADAIRTTLVGNMIAGEAGTLLKALKERPLAAVLSPIISGEKDEHFYRKNLYVTRFPGDVTASQLNELREEVTGIIRAAQPGDEALLILQSGGGTVTGYGLAAAQLQRFRAHDMKLTICVEQVAASGGYMMCCTADRIIASPFAVLGSIGVISEIPNAYERLKQEGIEFQTITAGKYKRTVTPTKKVTKEDLKKSEEDINDILKLFKSFVKSQRPQLNIDEVATGETWFGEDALSKGLCDELSTADDILLEFIDNGYDVYEVAYDPTPEGVGGLLTALPGRRSSLEQSTLSGWRGVVRSVVSGIVSEVKDEVMFQLSSYKGTFDSVERRYMAKDPSNASDRIQVKE